MKPNIIHPDIVFPFQKYDAKIPSNNFRVWKAIDNVVTKIQELQSNRREVEGITIDGSENTFLHDDGINIEKTKNGYMIQVSVVDTPEYIISEERLFLEALKRLETVYMFRSLSFMLPKDILDLLSLREWKTRPAITIEMELNNDAEIVWTTNIFRSYFKNVKWFNEKTFARQFLSYGSPFHDDLHTYSQLGKVLREKRLWWKAFKWNNFIPLHELVISEIVLVVNTEIAKIANDNKIPIAYAHRLNWDFRYSNKANKTAPYTRVTCPWRRALDMVTLWQITTYSESDWKELLFPNSLFSDLSRYNNTRSPFLSEHTENELVHIKSIQEARRTKRYQINPEQLSDEDIQYFFHKFPSRVNQAMKVEIELRIQNWPISLVTLVYILFSWIKLSNNAMKEIYARIKNDGGYWYFFNALKKIKFIDLKIVPFQEDWKITYTTILEIYGKKVIKDFFKLEVKDKKHKTKIETSNQKKLQKDIQDFVMKEYLIQLYSNARDNSSHDDNA